jgi:hypothetical protein
VKRPLLLVASSLAITLGGALLLYMCAFATMMDPKVTGTDYWLRVFGRLAGKDFLPGVVTALAVLLVGILLGLKGLDLPLGLHNARWNGPISALWLFIALVAVLLCCLIAFLS